MKSRHYGRTIVGPTASAASGKEWGMEVTRGASTILPAAGAVDTALLGTFQAALNTAKTAEASDARLGIANLAHKSGDNLHNLPLTPAEMLAYVACKVGFVEAIARASDSLISFDKRLKNVSGAKANEQQDN
jgi:hypothetical protein